MLERWKGSLGLTTVTLRVASRSSASRSLTNRSVQGVAIVEGARSDVTVILFGAYPAVLCLQRVYRDGGGWVSGWGWLGI